MPEPTENRPLQPRFVWVLIGFMLLLVVTRWLDLDRQSIWNDEVFNREYALALYESPVPDHRLTYAGMRLAMELFGDEASVWVLRFPSALLMSLAGLALFGWVWWRLGAWVGFWFAILYGLNPMAITYAQDANHYGWLLLGGALATIVAGEVWIARGWRWRIPVLLALAVVAAGTYRAHQFQMLGVAAMVASVLGAFGWQAWQGLQVHPRRRALVFGGLLILAGAIGLGLWMIVRRELQGLHFAGLINPPRHVFHNGIPFRALASFFGAFMQEGWLDFVAGFGIFGGVVVGGVFAWRADGPGRGVVIAAGTMLAVPLVFFSLFPGLLVLFQVRYLIVALGALLVLWAILLAVATDSLRRNGSRQPIVLLAGGTICLYVLRVVFWAPVYYTGQFQPLRPAMEHVVAQLPPDAIVGSRPIFINQALQTMGHRDPSLARDWRWLGDSQPSSRNAVGQALYLAARHPGRVYLLDLEWMDEELHVDYHQFSRTAAQELAFFPSFIARDFSGIGRSLVLRQVPDIPAFGRLPFSGADAIRAFPQRGVSYFPARPLDQFGTPALGIQNGAGASWFIRPRANDDDVTIDLLVREKAPRDWWLIGMVEETGRLLGWQLGPEADGPLSLRIPADALSTDPAGSTLHLWFPRAAPIAPEGEPETWLQFVQFRPAGDSPGLGPTPLRRISGAADDAWTTGVLELGKARELSVTELASLPTEGPVIALFPLEWNGIALHYPLPRLHWTTREGGNFSLLVAKARLPSSTIGPAWPAIVMDNPTNFRKASAKLSFIPVWSQGPMHGQVRWQAPQFWTVDRK